MKVGIVQTQWRADPTENVFFVYDQVEEICQGMGLDLVCLPEFFLGPAWYMPGQADLKGITDTRIPGPVTTLFRALARKHRVHILLGSMVEELPDGGYCNTAVLLDRQGEIVGRAHKVHAFANEVVVCRPGNSVDVIDCELGRLGIAVCSDFWVPETIRMLALKGAHTVLIPGGSLKQNLDAMINAFRATAFLNCVNLVYASPVGEITGIRGGRQIRVAFAGTSLAASPLGLLARGAEDRSDSLVVDLSAEHVLSLRERRADDDTWQGLGLRRPEAYGGVLEGFVGQGRDLVAETRTSMSQTTASGAR
ncbi:carbon-nitrogen hydrolase family protein [Myxococcus sp. K15C18031901]|uniref:carbon-nitrogen hydrolase family protein n=1 Tax=Myxococcus dinghuensis TaxID=2906761 RepID=UPI0020A7E303|nr:carbon-nitrogen hydrolase family protein [Myxococcus dinghuensis]MCP3098097.1 carbon-nitrogen hydrolase family protein [Myxococcus dinghuensis]